MDSSDLASKRDWPFEVLEPDHRTELQERELKFLQTAHREGFQPYTFGAGDFGAGTRVRTGLILVRGRKHWEVVLGTSATKIASAFVDDFDSAAQGALQWLRGAEVADVLSCVEAHLVRMPGAAHSFVLDALPSVVAS
jgi:hypothetical protein